MRQMIQMHRLVELCLQKMKTYSGICTSVHREVFFNKIEIFFSKITLSMPGKFSFFLKFSFDINKIYLYLFRKYFTTENVKLTKIKFQLL